MSDERKSLEHLCRVVYRKTGLDLRPYKDKFLHRRIGVRIRATKQPDLAEYVGYLKQSEDELEKLTVCLTIHVSSFFRNPSTFQAISEKVFPKLFNKVPSSPIKFWSVGCARGEEPYSLAILILEYTGDSHWARRVGIEAVDVDARVLEDAKRGEYGTQQLKSLDSAMVRKYFMKNGSYRLVSKVRTMVKFYRLDIFLDTPGGQYDFILCRNLFIYLEREAQATVLERFFRVLRPGGFLVLGRTEDLPGGARDLFEVIDIRERIYRRVAHSATA